MGRTALHASKAITTIDLKGDVSVMSTLLPSLPDPKTSTQVAIVDACNAIVEWAKHCEDVELVRDASRKMAAIAQYLQGRDAAAAAAAATRRLEARVGELLGPAKVGRPAAAETSQACDIPKDDASRFRKMAAHPEVVEEIIAQSTDEEPASRAKVLRAIEDLYKTVGKGKGSEAQTLWVRIDRAIFNLSGFDLEGVDLNASPEVLSQLEKGEGWAETIRIKKSELLRLEKLVNQIKG